MGYTLLALVVVSPIIPTAVRDLWGTQDGDAWQNWWNGWWAARAMTTQAQMFFTKFLWYPDGVSLWTHTLGPLNAVLTALGAALLPGFLAYNLLVLLHIVFGCFGAFVLCRLVLVTVCKENTVDPSIPETMLWLAAFVGGAVFGASPYTWAHFGNHLHLMSIGFLPLYAHALLRSLDDPGWRWPLLSAVWVLGAVLVGWWVVAFLVLVGMTAFAISVVRISRDGPGPAVRVLVAGLLATAVCLPFLLPTVRAHSVPLAGIHAPDVWSADLLSFWIPSEVQVIGRRFKHLTTTFSGTWEENAGYFGYVALALTVLTVVKVGGRQISVLLMAGLLGLALSLGPQLHIGGHDLETPPLPFALIAAAVPKFAIGLGVPVRFSVLFNLMLAVGTAVGSLWLASALARRLGQRWLTVGCVALIGFLALAEYWPRQLPSARQPTPQWISALQEQPEDVVVADLTGWVQPLYHQTLHQHPIVGGYVSRRPQQLVDTLMMDPVLGPLFSQALYKPQATEQVELDPLAARAHLIDKWSVRFFIVPQDGDLHRLLRGLGLNLVAASDGLFLYQVRFPSELLRNRTQVDGVGR